MAKVKLDDQYNSNKYQENLNKAESLGFKGTSASNFAIERTAQDLQYDAGELPEIVVTSGVKRKYINDEGTKNIHFAPHTEASKESDLSKITAGAIGIPLAAVSLGTLAPMAAEAGVGTAATNGLKTGLDWMGRFYTPSKWVEGAASYIPKVGNALNFTKTFVDPAVQSGFLASATTRLGQKAYNGTLGKELVSDALDASMLVGPRLGGPRIGKTTKFSKLFSPKVYKSTQIQPQSNYPIITYNNAELPGYQLKGFMEGSPLEKQLSKDGTISIKQLNSYLAKQDKMTQDIVGKVIKNFEGQDKINYKDLRKVIQENLVKYEQSPTDMWDDYGINGLMFQTKGRGKGGDASDKFLNAHPELMWKQNFRNFNGISGKYSPFTNVVGEQVTMKELRKKFGTEFEDLYNSYTETPDLHTFTLSSRQIPVGNNTHFNSNTLGHVRTYTTKEDPDILHILENQSDWAQRKTWKPFEKFTDRRAQFLNTRIQDIKENLSAWKKSIAEGKAQDGRTLQEHEVKRLNELMSDEAELLKSFENELTVGQRPFSELKHLGENYQQRQIYEILKYASENGLKRVRFPMSETAAKIEGYKKANISNPNYDSQMSIIDNHYNKLRNEWIDNNRARLSSPSLNSDQKYKIYNTEFQLRPDIVELNKKRTSIPQQIYDYPEAHKTILKKYADFPKIYEKLFGTGTVRQNVLDRKGNLWYEINVPENFLNMEWQYKSGGKLNYTKYFK